MGMVDVAGSNENGRANMARYAREPSDLEWPIRWRSLLEAARKLTWGNRTLGPRSIALRRILSRRSPPEI